MTQHPSIQPHPSDADPEPDHLRRDNDVTPGPAILRLPIDETPDPDRFVQAAMDWHFDPATGSPFWLKLAGSLSFDPRRDVRTLPDLARFPNVTDELRDVPAEDLIPRGYGARPDVVGVFESGGTTGAPKRVAILRDWWERRRDWEGSRLAALGVPGASSLDLIPSGPHMAGVLSRLSAQETGALIFTIDMDPRWVKQLLADGRAAEADAYAEHLIDQAAHILRTQTVGVLRCTPPLLTRLARRADLVELVRTNVRAIVWTGAHMDPDTRHLLRAEVFPDVTVVGAYGNTMLLGSAIERPGLADDEPCILDPFSPYILVSVVDPDSGRVVPYGERGRVLTTHISRSFFLPSNLERDVATRIEPLPGQVGDSLADVAPVERFGGRPVIEGVY